MRPKVLSRRPTVCPEQPGGTGGGVGGKGGFGGAFGFSSTNAGTGGNCLTSCRLGTGASFFFFFFLQPMATLGEAPDETVDFTPLFRSPAGFNVTEAPDLEPDRC